MSGENSGTENNDGTVIASASSARNRRAQLTQIGEHLRSQDNQDGFVKAKKDADRALAEKKIILKDRFVLESTLGAGGMGTVYKAQDLRKVEAQDTNPFVATKVLNSDFKEHPDAFIALQREASRSSRLAHPNIVTVHDFDRDGDTIYMTMELLQGEDLDAVLSRHGKKGLPKQQALKILADYCHALSFAHKKGIIHCDLKPANIFVTKEGAKVLDFGIARLAYTNQDHFDAGKMGALTPAYASVEMFNNEDPDQSDDVFAAAIIAYQMLCGKHPYRGKSAPAALAMKLEPAPIEGLSKRQWRALNQALKLKKAERTKTIREFAEAMTTKASFPVFKIISAVSLTVVAVFTYLHFFTEDELKTVVRETLATAKNCFDQQDFGCTINGANAILNIDPDHQEAKTLLRQATSEKEKLERNQAVQLRLTQAEQCYADKDYKCVLSNTEAIRQLEPDNLKANQIAQKAESELAAIEQGYQTHLSSAKLCLEKQDYACAVKQADLALEFKADDADALSLKQNADYAVKQSQQALTKAKNILRDGQRCFKKFDYSCAIAKSESALEFVPGYAPALKLKKDSEKAIANAKKAIQIE